MSRHDLEQDHRLAPEPDVGGRRGGGPLDGGARFGTRSVLGWAVVLVSLVPFLVLWLLIRDSSSALVATDRGIADTLNDAVRNRPALVGVLEVVTKLAGTRTAVLLFTVATAFLAVQRSWRLALFTATTGAGLAVLVPVAKALIDRARPIVEVPVVEAPSNASFPSGHSMTSLVLWGSLVLLALPAVRRSARAWLLGGAALLVLVVGATRMALGVHFLSDVLAGWALGAAWLAVTVLSFRGWRTAPHRQRDLDPLDPGSAEVVTTDDPRGAVAGVTRRTVGWFVVSGLCIGTILSGLGLLLVGPREASALAQWDRSVAAWTTEIRSGDLTEVAATVSAAADTSTVIALALATGLLALAATRSWRPMLFIAVALVGEALLYLAVSRLVGRPRPEVADLTTGLPSAASWPSGHAAAAAVLYGAIAAVVVLHRGSRLRWLVVAGAVLLPLGVALSRLYLAAHYPTDLVAGLVLGTAWLLTCLRLLPPAAPPPLDRGRRRPPRDASC